MTLLITVFAAIICTLIWYKNLPNNELRLGFLSLMFWGASLMWSVDAVFEYIELGAEFFTPEPMDMLNDAFLGISVVALGLIIWLVYLFIKDPRGVIKAKLLQKK
ncbi:MAG: hypothetical protein IIZ41_03945 [Lachnospiraceae bacterium]|jgi:hypothetical protein|nr:hypothetical protein [Lachnospiraceae bacterium]MBQ6638396.1 hypothetical protein [Lachnospiraceae bacterium]MBR3638943.1 hypothetical protein [Lachnospiraceae bacterium]